MSRSHNRLGNTSQVCVSTTAGRSRTLHSTTILSAFASFTQPCVPSSTSSTRRTKTTDSPTFITLASLSVRFCDGLGIFLRIRPPGFGPIWVKWLGNLRKAAVFAPIMGTNSWAATTVATVFNAVWWRACRLPELRVHGGAASIVTNGQYHSDRVG